MKLKISKIKRTERPSNYGGTWTLVSVIFDGIQNPKFGFDLKGYGKSAEKFAEGTVIEGYMTKGSYQGKNGPVETNQFNKITPEYVYGLLLKIKPDIEGTPAPKVEKTEVVEEEAPVEEDPGF